MKPRKSSPLAFLGKIEGLPIAAVLLVLYIVFIITAPLVFQGYRIYMSFLQTVPPLLVCGLGLTFVITAGEIDLSFSAVMAFSGFIFAWGYKTFPAPWGPWLSVLLALASGGLVGYINGVLVAKLRVPSIMATLAAQFFWSGAFGPAGGRKILEHRGHHYQYRPYGLCRPLVWHCTRSGVLGTGFGDCSLVYSQSTQVWRGGHVRWR